MRCTRSPVIFILTWIVSLRTGAESQQCTDVPTASDTENGIPNSMVIDHSVTCTAISTQQPPNGSVYYREAAAVVSYDIVDTPVTMTQFVRFECSGTSWSIVEGIDTGIAPPPSSPFAFRMDCYQCGIGTGFDPATLCLRKCGCMSDISKMRPVAND